jgi:uncharacterized protein YqjF (DUF2071 family)
LPYFAAEIDMRAGGPDGEGAGSVDYRLRRRDGRAAFSARYQPAGPVAAAAPGSLEFFLAERYLLYAWSGRALRAARVHHLPYPLQPARATDVAQTLTDAAGLPPGTAAVAPPLVHYASEVDVQIFGPRRPAP